MSGFGQTRGGNEYNYFLDESGNTGDLITERSSFDFKNQRFFVLSCVGVRDAAALDREFARLRHAYRLQAPEIKFGNVRKKVQFVVELLNFLSLQGSDILIEAVDKRYMLCAQIIESLIVPTTGPVDFGPEARMVKNLFADRLESSLPLAVFDAFRAACLTRNHRELSAAFQSLQAWLDGQGKDEISTGMRRFFADTHADFGQISPEDTKAVERYLPLPDVTRSGKSIQMLPHVYCMNHIYGRLNRLHGQKLGHVRLHHDEQVQFDRALFDGIALAESNVFEGLPELPAANFEFIESATLGFEPSEGSIGIQVADIVAGMTAFILKELTNDPPQLSNGWDEALRALFAFNDPGAGLGLNNVTSNRLSYLMHLYGR